jgi:CBS domain-containing protein
MLKAKDIMTKEVVSLRQDTPVEEALELLLAHEIAGLPVVEEDMTLVGIVTEKDLLGLFRGPEGTKGKTVEEFMTQPAVYFEENESLEEICKCLLEVTFRRVPVTRKGKVVGIVSRPDVLRCILQLSGGRVNP